MNKAPRVTVVGGGIAGLTAAYRLVERGYPVTLYERNEWLGGDLGSRPVAGAHLDVYPHMYLNWYHNLWSLLADATGDPPRSGFVPCETVWQLRPGEYPRFRAFTDGYSLRNPRHVLRNIVSGFAPPADMMVWGYANADLLAQRLRQTVAVDEMSVSAFMRARPYMTERAVAGADSFITMVWSLPSYLTSASDYQAFLDHCLAEPRPSFWLPRGSAYELVIKPLEAALRKEGAKIVTGAKVLSVSCPGGRANHLVWQKTRFDQDASAYVGEGEEKKEDVEEMVLAVNAPQLSRLVRTGAPGERIVEFMPEAAELSRLQEMPIPIMYVYFDRRLEAVPAEPVGLYGSSLALAFTDVSQTWKGMGEQTVLALSASDPAGLPRTSWQDDGLVMLGELAEYLGFVAPAHWGAPGPIDWERTRYDSNGDAQLFVNEIGTNSWRPSVSSEDLPNVCFAGDFCRNRVGMTTIESAVTAGVEAAAAIVERHGIGKAVEVYEPRALPDALFAWLRLVWAPYVTGAKMWSAGRDAIQTMGNRVEELLD